MTTLFQRFESPQMLPSGKDAIHQCYIKHPIHVLLCFTISFLYNNCTNSNALVPPCSERAAAIVSQMVNVHGRICLPNCSFPGMQIPSSILLTALYASLMSTTSSQPLSPSHYHAFTTNRERTIYFDCNDAKLMYQSFS